MWWLIACSSVYNTATLVVSPPYKIANTFGKLACLYVYRTGCLVFKQHLVSSTPPTTQIGVPIAGYGI